MVSIHPRDGTDYLTFLLHAFSDTVGWAGISVSRRSAMHPEHGISCKATACILSVVAHVARLAATCYDMYYGSRCIRRFHIYEFSK